jgi:two-component system response regulator VicR
VKGLLGSKAVFTTGDIAKMFGVNINTVVKWFQKGDLKGFSLPGSGTRRVPRGELLSFIASRRVIVESEPLHSVKTLLVTSRSNLTKSFQQAIESAFGYELRTASSAFEAGVLTAAEPPDIVVVHLENVGMGAADVRRAAARWPQLLEIALVAAAPRGVITEGYDEVLLLPARSERILDVLDRTAARKMQTGLSQHIVGLDFLV